MKIDTILFDLDGTLVDSNELILETLRQTILDYFPETPLSRTTLLKMMGPPLSETFGKLTSDPALVRRMISSYRKTYTEMEFDYISLYPSVREMLENFRGNGFKTALVTTKFRESALPSVTHFGIDGLFDFLIALDDVKKPKPDAEPLLLAMDKLHSRLAVMVGDTPSDILAGKNAGILTCGVDWSLKASEIRALNPDFWIRDFSELFPAIEKRNEEE